ncbi:hypothetical protein KSD_03490 [Ktedonobacter sp. SOSP1-85]|uniref:hypothetical protein n=1 Tax=Ktedonobacter sp. SOSP1-85 TaxID=2778367 RepID=UPI001915D806|nr:hypothetical protein [Ktedonobacter sp. SOSP1-85]GHO72578.1 hypothetical protein KSD_03490 [Ktedonobacter sp. SOSP1-85]
MPVLARDDELDITPRSLVRHRPILHTENKTAKKRKTTSSVQPPPPAPPSLRASRTQDVPTTENAVTQPEAETEDVTPFTQAGARNDKSRVLVRKQPPKSTRRLSPWQRLRPQGPASPLLYLGLGMFAMLLLWMVLNATLNWYTTFLDDWHYGRPRTFQTDVWVGHNEQTGHPSHFIAINLNRRIQIIELQGGDAAKARIYMGPQLYGASDDLVPVTLRFADLNNDRKSDMIVSFQQTQIVFLNDGQGFRQVQPAEEPQIEQALHKLGT